MFEVTVEQTFAAAHALRNYKGSCENMHGHNFKVQVTVEGEKLDEAGMLVDFLDLRDAMDAVIMAQLDHKNLNETPPFDAAKNPSAEYIAEFIFYGLAEALKAQPVRVQQVKVWETDIQSATYRP